MAPNLRKRFRQGENERSPPATSRDKRPRTTTEHSHPEERGHNQILHAVFDLIEARADDAIVGDRPMLYYPSAGTEYVGYSPKRIRQLVNKAATYYSNIVPPRITSGESAKVVALLGRSTLDYLIALLAISRLGHALLFLSPRLSEEAHMSLLKATEACCLLADDLSEPTSAKLQQHLPHIRLGSIATISKYNELPEFTQKGKFDPSKETNRLAWIIHSSGSTSLPKPTWISHASALGNFKSSFDLVSFVTLPLYHAQGIGWLFRGIMNKKAVYLYPGELPLTSHSLLATLRDHSDIKMLIAVPYVCQLLASSEEGVTLCKQLDVLFSGGATCPKPIGDRLVEAGVNLVSHFGSTETGQLMNSFRPSNEILDWDWLSPFEAALPFIRWEPYDQDGNIFELVVLNGWPAKVTANREDGAYATADLWERHPDYPKVNKWRYFARKDDTIVLVNGEKANPLIFEQLAMRSSMAEEAIVFGRDKARLGIFIVSTRPSMNGEDIIEDVWRAVKAGNDTMPAHGQVDRDMIKVLPSSAAEGIRRTDKGNIIRSAFYHDYASAIDAAYHNTTTSSNKVKLSRDAIVALLRSEISVCLSEERQAKLEESTDLFSLGIDSLQASRIRSAILKRGIDTGEEIISENIVFDFPSILALSDELIRLQSGRTHPMQRSVEERMQALIDKYSEGLELRRWSDRSDIVSKILVTGATGSLGAHIVSQLSHKHDVGTIICLVRAASNVDALHRVKKSLNERKVKAQWEKVIVYASDLSDDKLGLSPKNYESVSAGLKCVVHCAWAVNFNMTLESFENTCIRGVRHLIDLCLRSETSMPGGLIYCSSISATANMDVQEIPEHIPSSLKSAQATGYAQSKLVAEHICQNASQVTGLGVKILRIGQVAGDTKFGIWNRNEAVPMMLNSASTIGSLPKLDEWCSWLPVDIAASTILDIAFNKDKKNAVFNIVNPKRFHWTWDLMLLLRELGIDFDAERPDAWLSKLRSVPDPIKNPPYKLIDSYGAKYGGHVSGGIKSYATENTQAASPTLKHIPALDQNMIRRAIRHILQS